MTSKSLFRFSVTIQSDDLSVVCCLRGLTHCSQKQGSVNTSWGGTGEKEWRAAGRKVTFRFTRPEYREAMLEKADQLLPNRWQEVSRSDANSPG